MLESLSFEHQVEASGSVATFMKLRQVIVLFFVFFVFFLFFFLFFFSVFFLFFVFCFLFFVFCFLFFVFCKLFFSFLFSSFLSSYLLFSLPSTPQGRKSMDPNPCQLFICRIFRGWK